MRRSALHPATTPSCETTRPAVSGDRRVWSQYMLPIAHHRSRKLNFLVHTCAEVSIIQPTRSDCRRKRESLTLSAVNCTAIATYGQRSLTLNLGLRRIFCWIFVIADTSKPLLGADFLHQFGLLVDMAHGKLVDSCTHVSIHGIITEGTPPLPTITTAAPTHA